MQVASVQFLKHSVYRVESVAYTANGVQSVLAGLQSTAFMVCLLLFSVCIVQSSIQLSVGFRVYSVQCQFSVCSVHSSLLFLYYVVFCVMSVQYCLCVSRIECTQCSVSVHRAYQCRRSMQVVFRVYGISSVS